MSKLQKYNHDKFLGPYKDSDGTYYLPEDVDKRIAVLESALKEIYENPDVHSWVMANIAHEALTR